MRVDWFEPAFVETFPTSMKPGVLYVSTEYRTTGHLCACGCGFEVVLPLSPPLWSFSFDGENVSLWPSVGSWALPCKSHYVIDRGCVQWRRTFTPEEIARNQRRDRAALLRFEEPTKSTTWTSTQPQAVRQDTDRHIQPGKRLVASIHRLITRAQQVLGVIRDRLKR